MCYLQPTKFSSFHQRKEKEGQRQGGSITEQVLGLIPPHICSRALCLGAPLLVLLPSPSAAEPFVLGSLLVLPLPLLQAKAGTGRDVTARRGGAGMLGLPVFPANPVIADIG